MRSLNAFLPHPDITCVEGEIVAGGAGAEDDHATALHDQARDWEGLLTRMLEYHVNVVAFAGDVPDRFSKLARFLRPSVVIGGAHFRHLAPAIEVLTIDHALGAERKYEFALGFVRDHANGVRAGHRAKLDSERSEPTARAPDQDIMAGS